MLRSMRLLTFNPSRVAITIALAAAVIATAGERSYARQDSSAQLHLLSVVIPAGGDVPSQIGSQGIHMVVGNAPPTRLMASQSVAVLLTDGKAQAEFRYGSGLKLATTILGTERSVALPPIRRVRTSVVDNVGTPIAKAAITAQGSAGRFQMTLDGETDTEGTTMLEVPVTSTSNSSVLVTASGYGRSRSNLQLSTRKELTFALDAASVLRGTAVVADSKTTPSYLRLWKLADSAQVGPEFVVRRPVAGDFVVDDLAAGQYEIEFIVPKMGRHAVGPIQLAAGQQWSIGEVDLLASASMLGAVSDKLGNPSTGARVRLMQTGVSGDILPETIVDRQGRFEFKNIVPGEYTVEIHSAQLGWQTFAEETVALHRDQKLERHFTFSGSGCSLRIELDDDQDERRTYALTLPVSERQIVFESRSGPDERRYGSVPCGGQAWVQRLNGDYPRMSVPLTAGEAVLFVPVTSRRVETIRLSIAGQPLSGAAMWAVKADSMETVNRTLGSNVTDGVGRATVPLSGSKSTVYISKGQLTLVVGEARFSRNQGELRINLPTRGIAGIARDEDGNPVGGVSFGGSVNGADRTGSVTIFKGVTNADGSFEAFGFAPGTWSFYFTKPSAPTPLAYRTQLEFKDRDDHTVTVAPTLKPGR